MFVLYYKTILGKSVNFNLICGKYKISKHQSSGAVFKYITLKYLEKSKEKAPLS